jgi:L-alanine-DL-glutamate epimerase-like enolase superfamily enzyme
MGDAGVVCPIADVRATVLRAHADPEDLDSSAETLLLEVQDLDGRVGIGEADTTSRAGAELVDMEDVHRWNGALRGVLIGADPFETSALWDRMSERTSYAGPSGIAGHTVAGLDVALHDLAGKQLGRPAYQLLGGTRREFLSPYATVYAGAAKQRPLRELMDRTCALLERACQAGFRAVKMEVIFERAATDRQLVDCIREGRRVLGDEIEMLVDFGYRWSHWRDALAVLRRVEDCRLWLVEAAVAHDDLIGHARLARRIEPRVGGAELATTVSECLAFIESGKVDVLQPDVARAGGLTGMRRIAELAAVRGVEVVPHCWKTGIDAAAARQLQAASPNVPWVEMVTPELYDSPLRRDLVGPEVELRDGRLPLPREPGLGVELVPEAVEAYRAAGGLRTSM